jgi:PAP2 superfamily
MRRTLLASIVAWLIVVVILAASVRPSSAANPDVISAWSVAASKAAAASEMAPFRTPITFALLHLAMYDAVTAIVGDREPYAVKPPVTQPASAQAAAIEAGYRVLVAEFPTQGAALDAVYQTLLTGEPDAPAKSNGIAVGAAVVQQLLALRANDGRNAVVTSVPGTGLGAWVPTPPAFLPEATAFLAKVTPFTMQSPSQFRPGGPPALDSQRWADDYNEVKRLGASTGSARTAEQTATARFWEPLAGTVWPASIRRLAQEQEMDLAASAHFQAATFAAFADSLIACWDAKFHFNFWRPVTAIQQGATDGNDLTAPDPTWQPLATTPNFPEYPSGHACATAAVAHTIEDYFQHEVRIPARNIVSGEERFFRTAPEVVSEIVEARMLLGLHFRAGDEDGATIGRNIASRIRSQWFKRKAS